MQFPTELATEAEVILTLLIKPVSGEAEAGETRPGQMRVLAVEIIGSVFLSFSPYHDMTTALMYGAYRHMPHVRRLCEFMCSI